MAEPTNRHRLLVVEEAYSRINVSLAVAFFAHMNRECEVFSSLHDKLGTLCYGDRAAQEYSDHQYAGL